MPLVFRLLSCYNYADAQFGPWRWFCHGQDKRIEHTRHISNANDLASYRSWILEVIENLVTTFEAEFSSLWHSERQGVLFPESLFEAQHHTP